MFSRCCAKSLKSCYRQPLLLARLAAPPTHTRRYASELPSSGRVAIPEARSSEALSQGTRDLLAGNTASALQHFERALSLGSTTADTYYNKGLCEYSLGDPEAAIRSWEHSLALDSTRADVHANIGNAYFLNRRDTRTAIKHMERAVELAPSDAEIHFNLGCLYESLAETDKDLDAAIGAYDRAVQLGLDKAKTHLRNAMAKRMKRKLS
ncbi:hypothetical protein GGI20_005674 [Coemansia sp. BCRC 34301]|nr:hypothetical protein GGI20_005674 [Coemansia sp. BCRC 34301]